MTIQIAFIGTCQTVSLCYFLQQCLINNEDYNIQWVCYDKSFLQHLTEWSDKCTNKILDEDEGIQYVKKCDYIIYHPIQASKSKFFYTENLLILKNPECRMISLQRIHIDYYNDAENYHLYLESVQETKRREQLNNVDILVSYIFENNKLDIPLLLTPNHPTTYVFLEMLLQICLGIGIPYVTNDQFMHFMTDMNYMELPMP